MKNPLTIQLANVMIACRETNPKAFDEILVTGTVHRHIMLTVYGLLIKDKEFVKLEDLSAAEKEELWKKCHELINGRLSREHCIELVKAVYTMDIISQQ